LEMIDALATGSLTGGTVMTFALVAIASIAVVLVLNHRRRSAGKHQSGDYLREVAEAYKRYDNDTGKIDVKKMGLLCLIDMNIRPSNIHLRDVAKQCWEKNNPGRDAEAHKDDHFVELGDFAMFIQEVRSVTHEIVAAKKPRVQVTPTKAIKKRSSTSSLRRSSSSSYGLRYQVFLGGSCNPTTWRRDLAIPHLTNAGVTFYDPQVDNWSPRYVELEDQAKESSEILFFVVDNQTRGIASMVELAYLAGAGRTLVAVMLDFDAESSINGELLKERERTDLNRGHDFLCSILHREGIPLFEDISIALNYLTNMIRTGRSMAQMKEDVNATVPVFRGLCLTSGIFTANNTFKQYDALGNGEISMTAAQLALKSYFGRHFEAEEIQRILRIVDSKLVATTSISRNQFLCMVADTLEQERQASTETGLLSSFYSRKQEDELVAGDDDDEGASEGDGMARDVFLGGSCTGTWREEISSKLLRAAGLSYYDPDVASWTPQLIPLEAEAKAKSKVLLYVIADDTRGTGSLVEAAHFIGEGKRKVVLCILDIKPGTVIGGDPVGVKEASDLNRGRFFLGDLANKRGMRVFTDIKEATHACIDIVQEMEHGSASPSAAIKLSERANIRRRLISQYEDLGVH